MAEITFVHADVDSPDSVNMGSDSRRRVASTPARVTLDATASEQDNAHASGALGLGEFLLLDDDDDSASMPVHASPSPLEMIGVLGGRVLETDIDDDVQGLSASQPGDESTADSFIVGMDIEGTLSEEVENSASTSDYQDLTPAAQLPNDSDRESLAQNLPWMITGTVTTQDAAQLQVFSTFAIPPHVEQRDSRRQPDFNNAIARVLFDAKHEEKQGADERTTVVLMNIPAGYTNSKLIRTIDSEGFASMYDFLYVPMSTARTSKGFAFVNFVSPFIAQRFMSFFNGFSRWSIASKNVCHAVWAKKHQGLHANIERYRNSTVPGKGMPDECKPRLFKNGSEIPFPPPNRNLPCEPRMTSGQQVLVESFPLRL